jgi:hypothetical protein
MNKVCVALVALFLISQAVALECVSGEDTGECKLADDALCTWYEGDSDCCPEACDSLKAPDEDEADDEEPPCDFKEKCTDQLNLLFCGGACTPNWTPPEEETDPAVLSVCKKFADKLYSACKDSEFGTSADDCKAFGDEFDDAETFVKFYVGVVGALSGASTDATIVDGDDCLNSATSAVVSVVVMVAAALLA